MESLILELTNNIAGNSNSIHSNFLKFHIKLRRNRKSKCLSVLPQYFKRVKTRRVQKNEGYVEVIEKLPDDIFYSHFRMNRNCFLILMQEIKPFWEGVSRGQPKESLKTCLYVTLWVLANQNSYREISDRFNIAIGKVYNITMKTCKVLSKLRTKYIVFPSEPEMRLIANSFEQSSNRRRLPSVIGCVDGTHIKINAPKEDPISYYNRKGYHSMILQCICDNNLLIRDLFFGVPGSSHDASVWHISPIGKALANGTFKLPFNAHILGDSGYPLQPYLITPFRDNGFLSESEIKFNFMHSNTRVCIEQVFGILKAKFRILNHLKIKNLNNAKFIVMACAVLYNFIRINNNNISIEVTQIVNLTEEHQSNVELPAESQSGTVKREILKEWLFPAA